MRVFRLVNTGDEALTLDRKRPVAIRGADFAVIRKPRTKIRARGCALFAVRFKPAEAGARQASVQIRAGAQSHEFSVAGVAK